MGDLDIVVVLFSLSLIVYIQRGTLKIPWPMYLLIIPFSIIFSALTSREYFLITISLSSLSFVDIFHKEIPASSYWFVLSGLLMTGFLTISYPLLVFCVLIMFVFIDKIHAITMGGADLKLLLMLTPFFPTQLWITFLLAISILALIQWVFLRVFYYKSKGFGIALIPSISISFFILLQML